MARWEQYEIWAHNGAKWEIVGAFSDFEIASALARNYSKRMRLIHAVYDAGKVVEQDILMELGARRETGT